MWSGAFDVGALLSYRKYSQIEDCNWEIWLNRNVIFVIRTEMKCKNRNEITESK